MLTSPRRTAKTAASVLIALGASVGLAACDSSTPTAPDAAPSATTPSDTASSETAQSTASAAPAGYDIDGVDNVKNDFPDGFSTEAHPAKTLDQGDVDSSGVTAFTGAQFDPPQCRAVIIPPYAEPSVGTSAAGVRGDGDNGSVYVVALRLPQPVQAAPPPAGCDQVQMTGGPKASGTVQIIPAPAIAGLTTTGVKLAANGQDDPDYMFTAALDDHITVIVMGSMDDSLNPPQFMSDLLVKSVAAIRGQ